MNIKLIIAYEGTAYLGWQRTPFGPSVEETLKRILEKILQHEVILQAASRTDAGVHAQGQVVNFFTTKTNISIGRLQYSLNKLLTPDIVILEVSKENCDFHPTLDCKQKEYHYFICYDAVQLPAHRLYSWHCPRMHLIAEMYEATKFFVGTHNFSALCNFKKHQHYESFVREVHAIEIEELPQKRLVLKISGKNFLYKMVRNIVGVLAYVGMGRLASTHIPRILSSQDRNQASFTAPAHGLFLHKVHYNPCPITQRT